MCLALGVFGVLHQEITGRVNLDLLAVYTVLLGLPGAVGVIHLVRGSDEIPDTPGSSSASQPPPSQPPPSSASLQS